MKILIIHGPNLNMLGKRDPKKYGTITLEKINNLLNKQAEELNCQLEIIQSNHAGVLIDFLQKDSSRAANGLLINPGALIRFDYCFRQALVDFGKPFVEIHMSDINKAGVNKKVNIFDDVSTRVGQIVGLKEQGYLIGLEKLINSLKNNMNIILIGMKACGKSTIGKLLAQKLEIDFIELDSEIEKAHLLNKKEQLSFREIFKKQGADYFRSLEKNVLRIIVEKNMNKQIVLACGGGTPVDENNQKILKELGQVIFLDADKEVLLPRILKHGVPTFFSNPNDPKKSLEELLKKRKPVYEKIADKIINFTNESPKELVEKIIMSL